MTTMTTMTRAVMTRVSGGHGSGHGDSTVTKTVIGEVSMQNDQSCLPDWFIPLLEEWGREYGAGKVVDLSARSGTQMIWGNGTRRGYLTTEAERNQVNVAYHELCVYSDYAAGLIRFFYLGGKRRSMRDVELHYGLSNRAAGIEVGAAEALMFSEFMRLRKAA